MFEQVRATICKHNMFNPGDRILTGVSGGPDSVALVHVLTDLAHELDVTVCVAHLNHSFRGDEAAADAEFVRSLAARLGLAAVIETADVPQYAARKKMSAQVAAREVRYQFFKEASRELGCNKLALGHNSNDQAETILLHFLRGSGPAGLAGIPPVREGWITRPLIETKRDKIEEYCRSHNLDTRLDSSNRKDIYTRNRIRIDLIPLLEKEYNHNLVETLVRTGEIFREQESCFEAVAAAWWNMVYLRGDSEHLTLDLQVFKGFPRAVQSRVMRMAWAAVVGAGHNLEYVHLNQALSLLGEGGTGAVINLPAGVILSKSYTEFTLTRAIPDREVSEYCYVVKIPGMTEIPETGQAIAAEPVETAPGCFKQAKPDEVTIDPDRVKLPLKIRNRRPGDWFSPVGMEGTKKLKKFFIDAKIPRGLRHGWPVLATADGQIVWVVGLRADDRWLAGPESKQLLALRLVSRI